jgi:hypothetical protein
MQRVREVGTHGDIFSIFFRVRAFFLFFFLLALLIRKRKARVFAQSLIFLSSAWYLRDNGVAGNRGVCLSRDGSQSVEGKVSGAKLCFRPNFTLLTQSVSLFS